MFELWNAIPIVNKIIIIAGLSAMLWGFYLFIKSVIEYHWFGDDNGN